MSVEILHTDHNFRITRYAHHIGIEHKCEHYGNPGRWKVMWYSTENRGRRCGVCHINASEGLQASFWFLKEGA